MPESTLNQAGSEPLTAMPAKIGSEAARPRHAPTLGGLGQYVYFIVGDLIVSTINVEHVGLWIVYVHIIFTYSQSTKLGWSSDQFTR